MCGIAGIVARDPALRVRIAAMTDALRHRGPDDRCTVDLGPAALGSRRLAIQDPERGRQPMRSEDGTLCVSFNGEIYNSPALRTELERGGARFRTRCDTEVILHLYARDGERFVRRLEGMFAIALWDSPRRRLLLARDHLGQKPLFYWQGEGAFAFASEIKGLLAADLLHPRADLEALYHYMSLRFLPDDLTLFEGIRKLPAAHLLLLEYGCARLERYWELSPRDKLQGPDDELVTALEDRLRRSVRSHLLSDVPVGSFLSGGIDSSLVTALMAGEEGAPFASFSVGVLEEEFDELPFARRVAERFGTRHHERVVRADLVRLLPSMVWHLEEPADPFGVGVYLAAELASESVKVVLSGDGGDEVFGGYDRYWGQRLAALYAAVPAFLRERVLGRAIQAVPEGYGYKSLAEKLRWMHAMARLEGGDRYAESMSFLRFTEEAKARLFTPAARAGLHGGDSRRKILVHFDAEGVDDVVDRMLFTDLMTRIPDHLLPIVDRMAMAHGVEVRPPFLEHEVVEFGMRLPVRLKVRRGRLKMALRRVAARHLDEEIVNRPKHGFGFPLGMWMRARLRPVLTGALADSRFVEAGLFEREFLTELLREHTGGERDHSYRLWMLLNLEVWHRVFLEGKTRDGVLEWIEGLDAPGELPGGASAAAT